jgi:hypothetical protein
VTDTAHDSDQSFHYTFTDNSIVDDLSISTDGTLELGLRCATVDEAP